MRTTHLQLTDEVAGALAHGAPVVALESTIITHGMPWPTNAEMAADVEQVIRDHGAVPATIAVLDGVIRVGLTDDERTALAQASDVRKISRADLGYAVSAGLTGGTTVAATMIGAAMAGIEVFATGGIGGVHQGAQDSFDESADLAELARTAVVVVCAGAKAILDVPKTMERLETNGVPVVGYGTDEMPAFWSRTSGLDVPLRLDDADEIAAFHRVRADLGLDGGVLVANPIPADAEIAADVMKTHIRQATADAAANHIVGKDVTPYLLGRILELTDGESLTANIALVRSNAEVAAAIATALAAR